MIKTKILFILIFTLINISSFSQHLDDSETKGEDSRIEYYEPDYDTIKNNSKIEYESQSCDLIVTLYSLNDSLIPKTVVYEDNLTGRLTDTVVIMTHNNQGCMEILGEEGIIKKVIIDKKIFQDAEFASNFYNESTIGKLDYLHSRDNVITLSCIFGPPDSDWIVNANIVVNLDSDEIDYFFQEDNEEN